MPEITTDIIDQTRDLLPSFRAIQNVLCDLANEIDLTRVTNLKHTRFSLSRLEHALNKITITNPTATAAPTTDLRLPVEIARDQLAYTITHLRINTLQDLDNALSQINLLLDKLKDTPGA